MRRKLGGDEVLEKEEGETLIISRAGESRGVGITTWPALIGFGSGGGWFFIGDYSEGILGKLKRGDCDNIGVKRDGKCKEEKERRQPEGLLGFLSQIAFAKLEGHFGLFVFHFSI